MKLNQREQTIIKAMQGGERCIYIPYAGRFNLNAYYTIGKIGKCTREITKLIKLGLVEHIRDRWKDGKVGLTEAGQSFKLELEEPYDVWVVNTWLGVKVEKYSGFLKEHTLLMANGSSVKKGKDKVFFLNREEAFEHAFALQQKHIRCAENKVSMAKIALANLEKQRENPKEDKAGYL